MTRVARSAVLLLFLGSFGFSSQSLAQASLWQSYIKDGEAALREQDFAAAEDSFLAAVRAAESFPPGDPRLGKTLNNLAAVYYVQEDYARAVPLLARAAEVIERVLGPHDPDVAQALKNLAAVHYLQQDYAAAEPLLRRALAIWENAVGPDHPYVATVLSNLAGLYQAQGRFDKAEPHLMRALAIWDELLGADHPDVVESRKLLAKLREAQSESLAGEATADTADEGVAGPGPEPKPKPKFPFAQAAEPEPLASPPAAEPESERNAASREAAREKSNSGGTAGERLPFAQGSRTASPPLVDTARSSGAAQRIAVYLSSFRSSAAAEHHWEALRSGFPTLFRGKHLTVEEITTSGRGTFYRVLASPFESHAAADDVCREMKQQRQFCQVTRQ